ncbi:serine protease lint [Scaptodrosophila lebanonensis]|uniref:Serine protease lint n=1 Tax=Drosophila lebanonensis TaxID=7225 RepID=A0A6J2T0T0_DROLE|nr:serine protease lint [Scaptodrosophila lebanonensis]
MSNSAAKRSALRRPQRQLLSIALTTLIIIGALFVQTTSGFRSIETSGGGRKLFGGYRITPKHCRATKTLPSSDPRSNGPTICMFNHECAQRGGEVVGACMDGFLFGACCQIPQTNELASTLINDAQNSYFQQQQQQKLHMQNSAAAVSQSYESYGEQQQLSESQSQEQKYPSASAQQPQQDSIYDKQNIDKVYQQLSSSTTSNGYVVEHASQSQQDSYGVTQAGTTAELENEATLNTDNEASSSNAVDTQKKQPPAIHVHKHSVKISSPSSPPHNDDFVMQVLSTLPPEHENDHIVFTTEVPTKIASSIVEQTSSESSSFEEEPPATQAPSKPKPLLPETQKLAETMKRPVHQQKPKPVSPAPTHQSEHTNMHHHNHLILDGGEFTHSDITHPGADADLVEDLQFSTGYGPQPVFADPPKHPSEQSYVSSSSPASSAEDKYVLVQTFTSEKRPSNVQSSPTTVSSITTHVDSIESIILQLNNTSHGPSYNLVSQTAPQNAYAEDTTTLRPAPPASTASYYQESDTNRPMDNYYNSEADKTQESSDYTTSVNSNAVYNKHSEEQEALETSAQSSEYAALQAAEQPTARPSYSEDSSLVLDEHTIPSNGYNDAAAEVAPQTSQFNKMPAVGIAYPVDISYVEEESSEPAAYGQQSVSSLESAAPASTEATYQKISTPSYPEEPQSPPVYLRPTTNANKPNRPVASYIGMITMQNYNKQPSSQYSQVPAEVSVSSHTTKVQEQYADGTSDSYQQQTSPQQPDKLASYGVGSETTPVPAYTRPASTASYLPSTAAFPVSQPQYDNVVYETSSARPVLVTASPKPRPRPSTKRPGVKRPSNNSNTKKKTPKPQVAKQPSNNYNQEAQSTASYSTTENITRRPATQPANNFNVGDVFNQPAANYNDEPEDQQVYQEPPTAPVATYNKPQKLAQPALSYNEDTGVQPSLSYNQEIASSPTRRTSTKKPGGKKPVSTSYVTGPSTPRPAPTVDYHYDKVPPLFMADDKMDAFIQSTAENIIGSTPANYQPPIYATASTPIHVQRPTNNYSAHKKPGFVQINGTPKPPRPTVLITPKPTAINLVTSSSWTQIHGIGGSKIDSNNGYPSTTPIPAYGSTSYIYSSMATGRPGNGGVSSVSYTQQQPVSSNDFEDPGYFGMQSNVHPAFTQSTTEAVFAVPADDKPAFPGYYGPTPTYPAFSVPGEKIGANIEEETYTSPNDFVNFPPVRNPNLNMSAVSSAVTSDLELSTPAFVEDIVLKDKMNTLVHKLVASLQGNFEALADMIDDANNTASTYQAGGGSTTGTRKPTRKPVRVASTSRPKATTKKPVTRVSTKAPNKKTTVTTRKPATRRTTVVPSTTRRPASRKPTRRVSSTTISSARPADDEIVDEEDEEDVNPNPQENEIDQGATLSSYGGANGRKIQCGVRPHVKSGRIVGGKGSTFGAFPWQVLVRESTWLGLFTKNKCGGVLITSRYVITAAHCQPGFLASLVAVMGEFDISGDLESKRPITKNVKSVIVHIQYNPATFENDLALLELDSPVQFDTHIVPICMPNDHADFTGRMATVTGWGRLKYGGGVPSVLQEVQVPIIENSVCQEMFHTAGHNKKILNSFLCAGYANGQKDSCEGDSGGPLVLQRPDGRYELAGTVSHGIKCAAPYLPGVYMRTTFYKPWLRSITGVK